MKIKLDISPNASKFTQSMQSIPYSNAAALCDIIDNSLDANANQVHIIVTKINGLLRIKVIDNGDGMNLMTLGESLKFGSDTYKDSSQLGRFGMGLSTAIHHLCRRAIVITRNEAVMNAAIWDYNYIVKNNVNECEIGPANNRETQEFNKYIKNPSGTIIIFDQCKGIKHKDIIAFCRNLRNEISRKFRDKINSGIEIYINREICLAIDPLHLCNPNIEIEHELIIPYNNDDIKIKIVSLPKNLKSGNIGDKINNLNSEYQGFYVMRNGREIATAVDLGIYSKKDQLNRFRAQLDFTAKLDDLMGLDFTKNGVYLDEDLKTTLSIILTPILIDLEKKYVIHDNENGNYDYSEIEKIIQDCSSKLDFNLLGNSRTRTPRDEDPSKIDDLNDSKEKEDKKDRENKDLENENRENESPHVRNNVPKIRIRSMAIDSSIMYNYSRENGELVITLNTEHTFHKILISDKKISVPTILSIFAEISAEIRIIDEIESETEQNSLIGHFNRLNFIKSGSMEILLSSIKKNK